MNFSALDPTVDNLRKSHFDSYVLQPDQTDKLPVLVPFKVSSPVADNNVQPIQIKDIYVPLRRSVPQQHDLKENHSLPIIYNHSNFPQSQPQQQQQQQQQQQLVQQKQNRFYSYASPKSAPVHEISESSYYDLDDYGAHVDFISRATTPIPYINNSSSMTPKVDSRETSSKYLVAKKQGRKSPVTPNSSLHSKSSPELLDFPSFNSPKKSQIPEGKSAGSSSTCVTASVLPKSSSNTSLSLASYQVKESKKYQCKICEKCFTTSGHLARHTRIHTGERKHVCPFEGCNSRFARHDNCMQHYRTHLSNGKRKKKAKANLTFTSVH